MLAMDGENLANLTRLAPQNSSAHLALLRSFDPSAPGGADVPDPYYGGEQGFDEETVFGTPGGQWAEPRNIAE